MSGPAHSPLGPSAAERWINCAGSVLATADLPDTDSEYSLEGTAAHDLAERCRELDRPAKDFLGTVIDVPLVAGGFKEILVNQEMVDGVTMFIDHVNGLPGLDFNEQRVYYTQYVKDGFGTMDAARGNDGTVYIRDLKYGKGIQVFAKENEQLMLYALGFALTYDHLFEIEKFNLGIVQPRLGHIDVWEISYRGLLNWVQSVVVPAAEAALKPGAPFAAGPWCQFCKIRGTCKTRADSIFTKVVGEFDDLDDALDKAVLAQSPVGRLDNAAIAKILPVLPAIKKWCADIEKYAFAEVAAGRAVGDMKIVAGRGERALRQDIPVVERMKEKGITDEQLYEPRELRSVAQLEKVIGTAFFKKPTKTKEAGPFYELVEMKRGKPTLVPGSDEREAITLSSTDGFEDLGEDE